jgi:hypothetical protein
MEFTIRNPEDILASTHDGHLALPYTPDGIARLSGPGTEKALVMVARVRDERGQVVGSPRRWNISTPIATVVDGG